MQPSTPPIREQCTRDPTVREAVMLQMSTCTQMLISIQPRSHEPGNEAHLHIDNPSLFDTAKNALQIILAPTSSLATTQHGSQTGSTEALLALFTGYPVLYSIYCNRHKLMSRHSNEAKTLEVQAFGPNYTN